MEKVHSMTAFGRGEIQSDGWQYTCEVKTLNSRFIEVNIRMPRSFASLESALIAKVKSTLLRGKVDIFFDIKRESGAKDLPNIDEAALQHYVKLIDDMHAQVIKLNPKNFSLENKHSLERVLHMEGILKSKTPDKISKDQLEHQKAPMTEALGLALEEIIEARAKEGTTLKVALKELIDQVTKSRAIIEDSVSDIRAFIHDTYTKRLTKVLEDLEKTGHDMHRPPDEKVLAEISYLVEKADIEEEITRLKSHEGEFNKTLDEGKGIGRKLDFLCQEFHREVNTISSKLQPTEISEQTLKMKQTVERIRQQVQNIE